MLLWSKVFWNFFCIALYLIFEWSFMDVTLSFVMLMWPCLFSQLLGIRAKMSSVGSTFLKQKLGQFPQRSNKLCHTLLTLTTWVNKAEHAVQSYAAGTKFLWSNFEICRECWTNARQIMSICYQRCELML